jgi:hypothetical protein
LAFSALSASESGFPTDRLIEGPLTAGEATRSAALAAKLAAITVRTKGVVIGVPRLAFTQCKKAALRLAHLCEICNFTVAAFCLQHVAGARRRDVAVQRE